MRIIFRLDKLFNCAIRDMLRVEYVSRCNAMCAGFQQFSVVLLLNIVPFCYVCGMSRVFTTMCFNRCITWFKSNISKLFKKVSFTKIVKPLRPGSTGVLLVYFLGPFN